jgi:hypothetical protein
MRVFFILNNSIFLIQVCFCFAFGYLSVSSMIRLARDETADCFMQLGAYTVCSETMLLSVFLQIFFIMAQAMISRILIPGVSCFLNASVSRLFLGFLPDF